MLLSGVLQYLEEPYRRISELNDYGFHYIIVDRAPLIAADDDVLAVQHVQRNIYKASFPAWFFSERKFLGHFQRDYELIERFDDQLTTLQLGDLLAPMKGFIFRSSKQT
jgi:putative methyltransferase (TIGR04325 family)